MDKTFKTQFKTMIEIHIKEIDYLKIGALFAPYESYSVNSLKSITQEQSNVKYINKVKESFFEFLSTQDLLIDNTKVFVSKDRIIEYINSEEGKLSDTKTKLYYLLKLAFVVAFYQRLFERLDKKIDNIESLEGVKNFEDYHYFRGQTDFEWRMSPSILRNLKLDIVLDDNYYFKLLNEIGLEQKFNDLIKPTGFSVENKYNKYAFIQHSCSYSPFIDFTKDSIIATSFALSNSNRLNDFRNADSSIICMRFREERIENIIKDKKTARSFIKNDLKLKVLNSDFFVFGKTYELTNSDETKVSLHIDSIDKLLDAMTPKYKVLDIPTNDRMIYQKGLFICFYDCLCLKDFIAYELCPDLFFTKVCIQKRKKRGILERIYKNYRQYDPEHLMDPYLFFKE